MDALARQIEEAAAAWSVASPHGQNDGHEAQTTRTVRKPAYCANVHLDRSGCYLGPTDSLTTRTQAMDTLTGASTKLALSHRRHCAQVAPDDAGADPCGWQQEWSVSVDRSSASSGVCSS